MTQQADTPQTGKTPPITLNMLLTGDRSLFQPRPGDEKTSAQITVAELKDIVVAVNVSSDRILDLNRRLSKVEEYIEQLESRLAEYEASQE